jgi:predicted O-methyltransferase YrrM
MRFGGLFRERRFYESPAAIKAYRALRGGASRLGFQVVLNTFYSPIPELRDLPADVFTRRSELTGLDWDLDAQLRFVRERSAFMDEFQPPAFADGATDRFYTQNPSYSVLDATILFGVVRSSKPARVVELGSGHSTLVVAQAARANAAEGHPSHVEVYDPYPAVASAGLDGLSVLERTPSQDVPLQTFESLAAGDVLFVDTTHTVKLGSDVNFIVLEVLPRLAPGVIVHVHDIFLPYEYPRRWPEDFGLYWTEQYLLHAFLAMNTGYEILCGVAALNRDRRQELVGAVPRVASEGEGSALWIRRTGPF